MKRMKNVAIGLLVSAVCLSVPSASYADKGKHEAFIKLLNDSAAALQAAHPDLAASLTQLSGEEAKEVEGKKEGEGKEEKERHERHEAHIKLLRDSAAALQSSHPDLSAELTKTADRKTKRMAEEEKKEGKED